MSALLLLTTDTKFIRKTSDIGDFNKIIENYLEDNKDDTALIDKYSWFYTDLYKKIKKIKFSPTELEIIQDLTNDEVLFLDYKYPNDSLLDTLVIKELPLINGILTEQENDFDVKINESLEQKLGLEVKETTKTFDDLVGAKLQIEIFEDLFISFKKGRLSKVTAFLLGIPGAGKTFLAECIAGQYKRMLIKLDLSRLMQMEKPILKWHSFCRFLEMLHFQGVHIVGLLDEIAQALAGGNFMQNQFKGQLLTTIEDFNTNRGYQIGDSLLIGTDNNIRDISLSSPQFMARWEEKIFINFPKEAEAKSILKYYLDLYGARYSKDNLFDNDDMDGLFSEVSQYFHNEKIQYSEDNSRFIYAPREINKFASRLATISDKYFEKDDSEIYLPKDEIIKCCERVPPQQKMLKLGISSMINDAGDGWIEI